MFFQKIINKTGKLLARFGPVNKLRVLGLRLCGCKVGKNVYIGEDLIIVSNLSKKTNIKIGDRVSIAPRVTFITDSHSNHSKISEYIMPLSGEIIIEDDVWIGTSVVIMPNVIIGNFSVIGAMSLVNKNLPSHTISIGIPAKLIKKI